MSTGKVRVHLSEILIMLGAIGKDKAIEISKLCNTGFVFADHIEKDILNEKEEEFIDIHADAGKIYVDEDDARLKERFYDAIKETYEDNKGENK